MNAAILCFLKHIKIKIKELKMSLGKDLQLKISVSKFNFREMKTHQILI